MANFTMPLLGADMQAGTLLAWRKKPGDAVRRGDTIAEVETEKGVIDVEVLADGVVEELLVPAGTKVPVGTLLARLREPGAAPRPAGPAGAGPRESGPPETGEERPLVIPAAAVPPPALERLRISPSARRLARQLGVTPAALSGTGRGGAITREDIERAAVRPPPPETVARPSAGRQERMRQAIAAAMSRSKREIPHYYLSTTIDMHRAAEWLADRNAARPVEQRLLPGVLLLKAAALALREVPELNAVWEGTGVVLREKVHVGVAIALRGASPGGPGGGLVILALHDTATRPLDELMDGLRDLTARARAGRMKSSELADSTITVTSLGDRGVEAVFGVIYPPQVAIVGFGRITDRPWAVAGGLHVRPLVTATLAADHRVSDGHRGGLYLEAVDRLLQEPGTL